MNLIEGAKRIQRLARIAIFIALGFGTVALLLALAYTFLPQHMWDTPPNPLVASAYGTFEIFGAYSFAFGAIFWLVGWLLEGFAQPKS